MNISARGLTFVILELVASSAGLSVLSPLGQVVYAGVAILSTLFVVACALSSFATVQVLVLLLFGGKVWVYKQNGVDVVSTIKPDFATIPDDPAGFCGWTGGLLGWRKWMVTAVGWPLGSWWFGVQIAIIPRSPLGVRFMIRELANHELAGKDDQRLVNQLVVSYDELAALHASNGQVRSIVPRLLAAEPRLKGLKEAMATLVVQAHDRDFGRSKYGHLLNTTGREALRAACSCDNEMLNLLGWAEINKPPVPEQPTKKKNDGLSGTTE